MLHTLGDEGALIFLASNEVVRTTYRLNHLTFEFNLAKKKIRLQELRKLMRIWLH